MAKKLLNDERLIIFKQVSAGEAISARAEVQHNYAALANQAKMMITGKFGIEQQWLFKAGSPSYNIAGAVIDYSGEGNDAAVSNSYCYRVSSGSNYLNLNTGFTFAAGDTFTASFWIYGENGCYVLNLNNGGVIYLQMASTTSTRIWFAGISAYTAITHLASEDYRTGFQLFTIVFSKTSKLIYLNGVYKATSTYDYMPTGINRFLGNLNANCPGEAIMDIQFYNRALTAGEILAIYTNKTSNEDCVARFTCSEYSTNILHDVVGSRTATQNNTNYTNPTQDKFHYNLKYGFTIDSSSDYIPYKLDGTPIAVTGTNHPSGNYHNGAESKIALNGYGAKSYAEMLALSPMDGRFELVIDDDGNLSEIKVTKLTEVDTEHYTLDNNVIQEFIESGNLISPIEQGIKLIFQGGDNANIAAFITLAFNSGAQITITAATSGIDGNNIEMVFVVGAVRGVAVSEGATTVITLTYQAGDTIANVTTLLGSVNEYITYSVGVAGVLSDESGLLTGGFTPELDIHMVRFNGKIAEHPGGIVSLDETITITGIDARIFVFPCEGGQETVITCEVSSVLTITRPQIIVKDQDGNIIDSDTAIDDTDTLEVSVTPVSDQVYIVWFYARDSGAGAGTTFSNFKVDGVDGIINAQGEIYPVLARMEPKYLYNITPVAGDNEVKLINVSSAVETLIITGLIDLHPGVAYQYEEENPVDPVEIDQIGKYHKDQIIITAILDSEHLADLVLFLDKTGTKYIEFDHNDIKQQYPITDIIQLPEFTDDSRQYWDQTTIIFESRYSGLLPIDFDAAIVHDGLFVSLL